MTHPTVSLREVTRENLRAVLRLELAPGQERFVAPNSYSIAEAYFYRDTAWFRAIYADEEPVGFLMLSDQPEKAEYYLWRFMIDAKQQGKGYGRAAIELLKKHVATRPNATALTLSHVPGEEGPAGFYQKLGFSYTGAVDDGELVMKIDL